jgi:hypothetical protein
VKDPQAPDQADDGSKGTKLERDQRWENQPLD